MFSPDVSLAMIVVIIACEAALLSFLYFISRFYEVKFGQGTYSAAFIVAAALLAGLLALTALDVSPYVTVTLANVLALAVLAVFGLRLFRIMTGVTK